MFFSALAGEYVNLWSKINLHIQTNKIKFICLSLNMQAEK